MKNHLSLLKSDFIRWLKSDKQMLTFFALIYSYLYVITPMREYSEYFNEPLGLTEAFVTLMGNGFSMVVITITFLMLIIDFPDMSSNAAFVLYRTGRKRWLRNQCLFVMFAAFFFMLVLVLFSVITTANISFSGVNAWSNAVNEINDPVNNELKTTYPLGVADLSIVNNFRPYKATAHCFILMFLQMTLFGQLQICLTVRFNRITAMVADITFLVCGLYFWNSRGEAQWFFTIANSTCGWHFDPLYNITVYPIWASYAYMITLNVIVLAASGFFVRKKSFVLGK